ncbi:MAG TPA: hypothetical protein VGG99_26595 [Acetobacteraceae bacterium]|jgi:hypothetical protein
MTPSSGDTDLIPPALAARIQAVAEQEQRGAADVVREALERYLAEVPSGHRRRRVFKTEELSDADLAAMTEGRMDSRHDQLNAELE